MAEVTVQYAGSVALARIQLVDVSEPKMVVIPGGAFQQGDIHNRGTSDEQPVHEVSVNSYALGEKEVTFAQYDRYLELTGRKYTPSDEGWGRATRPVINVSWHDAKDYVAWLSKATGKSYRLPTESEWEYAARSGGKEEVWAGTSERNELEQYAVFSEEIGGRGKTSEVGSKKPNAAGLV